MSIELGWFHLLSCVRSSPRRAGECSSKNASNNIIGKYISNMDKILDHVVEQRVMPSARSSASGSAVWVPPSEIRSEME
jgi:hypothetical protein